MIFVGFCSLYVSKIVNFGRCINLLQAKNVKWRRLIWPTLYMRWIYATTFGDKQFFCPRTETGCGPPATVWQNTALDTRQACRLLNIQ